MPLASLRMNASEFLPFLGHSSIHGPFDDFLTQHGFTKRPKVGRRLETSLTVPGTGLNISFDFDISASDKGFVARSQGSFVFTELEVTLIAESKKYSAYSGVLPREILASDSRRAIEQKLGAPKRRNAESDNYFLDGYVWTVAFESERLQFIQFSIPSAGWRKYGICP